MGKKFDYQFISNNTNQVFKNKVRALTGGDSGMDYHRWIWLMDYLKWYTNHFVFEGNDELENIKDAIIEKLYWNGYCAVCKVGDKPFVLNVSGVKYNMNKEIISAKRLNITQQDIEDVVNLPKKLDKTNTVFCKSNFYSFPLFMGLDTFINPILELWDLMPADLINAISNNLILLKNDDEKMKETLLKEMEEMTRRRKSLFKIIKGNGLEIQQLKSDTITEQIQGFFKFVINYGYSRTGRLFNVSEKQERNLTSEVSLNELQFQVIRNDLLSYLEKFAKNYDELYGTTTKIITLQEIEEERQAEMKAKMGGTLNNNKEEKEVDKNDDK